MYLAQVDEKFGFILNIKAKKVRKRR